MVSTIKVIFILVAFIIIEAYVTSVSRNHVFLSRRKRYLTFPVGSAFIITLSLIKPLLQEQPGGWTIPLECDVPFALPTDTRLFGRSKRQVTERQNLLRQLEEALTAGGLNGTACIKRTICEVVQYRELLEESLAMALLYAVFAFPKENLNAHECKASFVDCSFPLLKYLIGSLSA